MGDWLKQSTVVVIEFGPFVDAVDGKTLETGLVSALDHASTGIMLSKNGGALTIRSQTVTASTYDAHGTYRVTLSTTDTNTLGLLRAIYTDPATCLPVWRDFFVLPAVMYDSIGATSGGTFSGITSLAQWLGLLAGKQTGNSTARTELRATGAGSGTYDEEFDSLEAVRDQVDDIETAVDIADITVLGPTLATGDIVTIAGDSYENEHSRAIQWQSTGWTDLTGLDVNVNASKGGTVRTYPATVVDAGAATQIVRLELTDEETAALPVGEHDLTVVATNGTTLVATLVGPTATSRRKWTNVQGATG